MNAIATPIPRPPVVAVMGHIDHGKSSLLDYIRKSKVVEGEAGGITQHLSAYEVVHESAGEQRRITFLDTPGHEAFQKMRARGSAVADVAILVVSAEDGVKPQTLEAWHAITEANIPFVVAITKIDKPNANIERAKASLLESGIYLEGMGGTISFVPVSSKRGDGISELLDVVVLAADLAELSGDPSVPAEGVVIEAHRDPKKGVSATMIIKNGTLKSGQFVAAGSATAPTRQMTDFRGGALKTASFSQPVTLSGFSAVPPVGVSFRAFAEKSLADAEAAAFAEDTPATSEERSEKKLSVSLVVKADVSGSLEAIEHEIKKREDDDVSIRILHRGVGGITEGDLKFGSGTAHSAVVGFNVTADSAANEWSRRLSVPIQTFSIIYKLGEWLDEYIEGLRAELQKNAPAGEALVVKTFSVQKRERLIGVRISAGTISVGSRVTIVREGMSVGDGHVESIRRQKNEVDQVDAGNECGMLVVASALVAEGDLLHAHKARSA